MTRSRAPFPLRTVQGIEKFVARIGYPAEFAHHLKPWFLAILTAIPACEADREALNLPEVDQFLAQTAKDEGVKVIGLETPEEQLDAIANLRPEVAATLLILAARDPGLNDDLYATMLKLYRESRPAEILAVSDALGGVSETERAAEDEFMRELLLSRNAIMASAPLRSWPPAARSSPSARCISRARPASSSGSAPWAIR